VLGRSSRAAPHGHHHTQLPSFRLTSAGPLVAHARRRRRLRQCHAAVRPAWVRVSRVPYQLQPHQPPPHDGQHPCQCRGGGHRRGEGCPSAAAAARMVVVTCAHKPTRPFCASILPPCASFALQMPLLPGTRYGLRARVTPYAEDTTACWVIVATVHPVLAPASAR